MEAYILIVLELLVFCTARFVKLAAPDQALKDWQLAPRHEDAEIFKESVYLGCLR
jgi:hypothetical protein